MFVKFQQVSMFYLSEFNYNDKFINFMYVFMKLKIIFPFVSTIVKRFTEF